MFTASAFDTETGQRVTFSFGTSAARFRAVQLATLSTRFINFRTPGKGLK